MTWENKVANTGIHYSRYIASWTYNVRCKLYGSEFRKWLSKLGLTEEEQQDIYNLATNGKMELELGVFPRNGFKES